MHKCINERSVCEFDARFLSKNESNCRLQFTRAFVLSIRENKSNCLVSVSHTKKHQNCKLSSRFLLYSVYMVYAHNTTLLDLRSLCDSIVRRNLALLAKLELPCSRAGKRRTMTLALHARSYCSR